MKRVMFLALCGLLIATVACSDSNDSVRDRVALLSLEETYARMEEAITREGEILHVKLAVVDYEVFTSTPFPGYPPDVSDARDEMWIDAAQGVARREERATGVEEDEEGNSSRVTHTYRKIVRPDATYRQSDDERADDASPLTCRGAESPLISLLISCGNYLEESTTVVEAGEYDGRPALVLASAGELPSHDWTTTFTSRLYVDPDTHLPIAQEDEHDCPCETDGGIRTTYVIEYAYDFIERSAVADDFFEPASIGWSPRDPAANLVPDAAGMRVYWLGKEFAPAGGLPALTLEGADLRDPGDRSVPETYRVIMSYRLSDDRFGPPIIGLQEYSLTGWAGFNPETGGHWWNWEGTTREDIALPEGRAVLFLRTDEGYNRYLAHVYFDSTVVMVSDFAEPSAYSSREAFIAVIEALKPFERPAD